MLEILNRYAHGLVAVPLIHALQESGCLTHMEQAAMFSAEQLENRFSGNRGCLDVALRMLECLGWIRSASAAQYEATEQLANCRAVPDRIMELYRFPFDQYVQGNSGESLAFWLESSERRWSSDHPALPDYLDGLLVVPLLLALKTQGRLEVVERKGAGATLDLRVDPAVRREIERLFVIRNWASARTLQLNRAGRFIVDRILVTAAAASYRPMFLRAQELLFGDAAQVFALDPAGRETHVDRTLNVIGSGFQHEKYFAALGDLIVQWFDHEDYSSQPKYIVDMGCGDGSLLRRLYQTVRDRTRRGQALAEHPLVLIAVDLNDEALAAATRTLDGIDHIALKGDIGDPLGLLQSLQARGVEDLERVLHVRSFMDHNRPYREPEDHHAAERRSRFGGAGLCIDANGRAIPPGAIIQSTIEHLKRWSRVVNRHGLIALEVHCLPVQVTARYLDESESFHFDLYHALSHQYLLEAETFLACAAEAGLFCGQRQCLRFPKNLPFTRISLNHFEKRPYAIRRAQDEDLPALLQLQRDEGEGAHSIETQLREYPEGQFVLVAEGEIAAAVCCVQESSGSLISVRATFGDPSYLRDLLQFVEQYWSLKTIAIIGIEECRSQLPAAPARRSVAHLVARDVAARVAGYPFAAENDPRVAERELGEFAFRWVLGHLQRMGALRQPGEAYDLNELKRLLRIAPKYHNYFEALMRKFEQEGLVTLNERRVQTTSLVRDYALQSADREAAEFKRSFEQRYPSSVSHLNLTACCLSRYEEIVTGQIDITEVLFEDPNMDVFSDVFRGDAVSDYFNRIVADAVHCTLARVEATPAKIRILEVGAGTGGTTAAVLDVLQPFSGRVEFCFTDVSLSFVRQAKRRFAGYPWVDFRSLNIEQDLSRQGFEDRSFNIIVAANVLHDTRDIEITLEQTRRLLKPGGLLLLNEYTSVKDCLSFSGALLHGWWLFEDPERRLPDSCLLSVPQWRVALEHSGFDLLRAFTLPTQGPNLECSQSVMLCESGERPAPVTRDAPQGRNEVLATVMKDHSNETQKNHGIIGDFVERGILAILGPERSNAYLPHRPVMEMGLDSIELVELRLLLEQRFSLKLAPAFLFEHETQEKIAGALAPVVPEEKLSEPPSSSSAAGNERPHAVEHTGAPQAHGVEKAPIAIVGVACRFPGGSTSPEEFWNLLERVEHGIVPLPAGRWEWPAFVDLNGKHKGIAHGGFLDKIGEFDAPFFRTSRREAELMDPQQRLLLELSWELLEDAGHRPSELSGRKVGVFIGACHFDYRDVLAANRNAQDAYIGSGGAQSMLANRLSYFHDLKGPSLSIDTACSSSLFALHEAVCSLRRGDCEQAMVGGVNLLCSPTNSIAYYEAGMLSPTGECRTFDAAANGFVRGEGGAMLLLKPLDAALADGDSIYGLVKSVAVNHGGQATSLTAPKPDAQAAVIEAAWLEAGAAPESVGYIETHGTGTTLGDPIEISGLIEAFERLYQARDESWTTQPRCALGSVKTNIGHLEGAAGLAGLIKVLMCMRHRLLPATVNFEHLNPDIDLEDSPLYIVERNQVWTACRDQRGHELPRRAGVSSFGFGGANAHAVIEEYRPLAREAITAENGPFLIPLSARSQTQLVEQARRLLSFLERSGARLSEAAYTLQVGRASMQERVAFIVESTEALIAALRSYAAGESSIPNCYRGAAKRGARKQNLETSLARKDLPKLASLWTNGTDIDWTRLYQSYTPGRIHLPTYPFAWESYWISAPGEGKSAALHALVQRNTSDLEEQRYSSTFTGQEFFLADHRIGGQRWLPAVAYLEMAREAVALATKKAVRLKDVVWLRPLAVGEEPVEVHIGLYPEREGIAFEIYSAAAGAEEGVYARGWAVAGPTGEAPRVDVEAIQARCQAGGYAAASCYAAFAEQGIVYGEGHRGIEVLYAGANEALAKLRLPASVAGSLDQFVLHPSLMDGALQTILGFSLTAGAGGWKRALPFELRSVEIHGACTGNMWAVARREEADGGGEGVKLYDIDVCDQDGRLCVRLKGLGTHVSGAVEEAAPRAARELSGAVAMEAEGLQAEVQAALARTISKLIKLPLEKVRAGAEFNELGLDSIALIGLADQLNADYGLGLKPDVFFEYPTLERFSRYLAETRAEALAPHFGARRGGQSPAAPQQKVPVSRARRARFSGVEAAEPIAIVGMSGRFPMARDVDELWENLLSGRDCISEIPPQRWDWREVYGDPAQDNKTNIKWGGFIQGVDEFDPQFFNISTREAELMDPQQRLLMLYIWKAIEDAGYSPGSLWGSNTGIFVGTGLSDYARLMAQAKIGVEGYTAMGTVASVGPNRMSYFLNLHGPSEPVETTCSSSLVAIHRAVSAMRSGQCEMALVGGVNTILTPDLHISCNKAGMLSASGRCHTFSDRADGYVRSEGIGILMLKKLTAAEQAGDHIYGVILGSAENHGGRANSFTSPNPQAQAELLRRAYTQAGVDPASVSYIEAHGTGTQLGDPIEVEGLKSAFRDLYQSWGSEARAGHCGLGSVKSNIGHLELAAGVAGVIKVLLQMKHRTLAPGLHCETVNPYIQLEGSPFYLVRERTEWRTPGNGHGEELPRRGGVSSFGFGGVNAHVVLEEYVPRTADVAPMAAPERPAIVVLSARNAERLREQAEALLAALAQPRFEDGDLAGVAYTLQVGRDAMDERLGVLASSLAELREKLRAFLNNEEREGIYRGQARKNEDVLSILTADKEFHNVVGRWIEQHQSEKLLELWVKGMQLDWERLYAEPKPRRLSLPTYPFARESYWLPKTKTASEPAAHPLLNPIEAADSGLRFSTALTGDEFFLTDHVVQGRRVLPAVVYLELARAAAERATRRENRSAISLRGIVWMRPFFAGSKPAQLHVQLTPESNGDVRFEISSDLEGTDRGAVVHAQGRAGTSTAVTAPTLDLAVLRARCNRLRYSAEECYGAFDAIGYHYGPAHRRISEIYVGTDELLSRINPPAWLADVQADVVLHPAVADAALQAIIGFLLADRRSNSDAIQPALPFELDRVEMFGPCAHARWASIRREKGKFDIDLCDDDGRVSVRFRGWTARPLEGGALSVEPVETAVVGDVILTPAWEPVRTERHSHQAPAAGRMAIIGGAQDQRAALQRLYAEAAFVEIDPGETIDSIGEKMADAGEIGHLVWIVPEHLPETLADDSVIAAQRDGALLGFRLIKAALAAGYGDKALTWTVLTSGIEAIHAKEPASPTHASVHGLIGSMAKEYTDWNVRLMDLPSSGDWPWEDLFAMQAEPFGNALVYRDVSWYRRRLTPYRLLKDAPAAGRSGEVYVIIGGAGGIGSAWSEALLRRSRLQLVWIGRRPIDDALQSRLDRLAELGPAPVYISADATDRAQLERARTLILDKFGRIDGLVHAAMVLQDQSLANMTEDAFRAGLGPKVDACVRLAQVFGQDPPGFVLFFSSCNAFIKSPGQSNYVAGCTFEDAFARRMAAEWPCRVRVINWGYWGSVGAVASELYQSRMARKGFGSIELPAATRILDHLLSGRVVQLAYLNTTHHKALEGFNVAPEEWAASFEETLPSCLNAIERVSKATGAAEWPPSPAWRSAGQELDDFLIDLLWSQLQSMRLFSERGASCEDVQSIGSIQDRFGRWLEHSIRLLEARGYLVRSGQFLHLSLLAPADAATAWQSWESRKGRWLDDPDWEASVRLAEAALRVVPDILTGRRAATEILFADFFAEASTSRIAKMMRSGPVIRFCNQAIAQAVVQYVKERRSRDPGCELRILEIGAGTGSTTEVVLEALAPHAACLKEYACTDISMPLLSAAKKWLPSQPAYLSYLTFDIEQPPAAQDIALDRYDLVIASNVLHATKDMRRTLRNAKAVLKTNGLLMLNEIAANTTLNHLTVGFLDGWWLFSDTDLRIPGGPALAPERWRAVLRQEGFGSVLFLAGHAQSFGHQVIVAESDGLIRQPVGVRALPRQQEPDSIAVIPVNGAGQSATIAEIMSRPRQVVIDRLLSDLRLRAAEELGVDAATLDSQSRPFADTLLGEFGMDSLSSNNLRNALRHELGVDIPVQRIIGEKVRGIVDTLYDELLIRQVSNMGDADNCEDRETYVF